MDKTFKQDEALVEYDPPLNSLTISVDGEGISIGVNFNNPDAGYGDNFEDSAGVILTTDQTKELARLLVASHTL